MIESWTVHYFNHNLIIALGSIPSTSLRCTMYTHTHSPPALHASPASTLHVFTALRVWCALPSWIHLLHNEYCASHYWSWFGAVLDLLRNKHHSFFFSAVQQGTSVIANHLQIEAAIRMVISTAPNMTRDVPYDSALMICLHSNVLHEKFQYSSPSSIPFFQL